MVQFPPATVFDHAGRRDRVGGLRTCRPTAHRRANKPTGGRRLARRFARGSSLTRRGRGSIARRFSGCFPRGVAGCFTGGLSSCLTCGVAGRLARGFAKSRGRCGHIGGRGRQLEGCLPGQRGRPDQLVA